MSMTTDFSDFLDFADDCDRAAEMVPQVMSEVATDIGFAIEGRAVVNALPNYKTGSLAEHTKSVPKSVSTNAAVVEVASSAVSGTGFPYPLVIDQGRKEIIMPKGRAMKFEGKDGKVVFARKIRAYAGTGFFTKAVDATKPEMPIFAAEGSKRLLDLLRR